MLAIFYKAVVQAVLLFGSKIWILLSAMARMQEGFHVGFLWKVTEKIARW